MPFASFLTRRSTRWWAVLAALAATPALAAAEGGHADPSAKVALAIAAILIVAKIGGDLAMRIGQPSVLGELVFGVALGNLDLAGVGFAEVWANDPSIDMLARLGVLILLFEVGLESTVGQMMKVGASALLVATLGVVAPFVLGWGVSANLIPDGSFYLHMFLGATLTATSVGITARVLKDLGRSASDESRVILGAAVIDDVMGLVCLTVVTGMIAAADAGGTVSLVEIAVMVGKAVAFLLGSLIIGAWVMPRFFAAAARLRPSGVLLASALAFCFFLSWLANLIGLAPIVGAFAAGLILEEVHFRKFAGREEHQLESLIHPISAFLVPVFFVVMGMRTDLASLADRDVLLLAGALTIAAILGKLACSLGMLGKGVDRLTVGIGMIPRGEVGLIFANIGATLVIGGERIVSPSTFSAVVVMVVVTTLVTPPALRWSLARIPPK